MQTTDVDRAAAAIADGDLVVYPTETVYGLGANALDAAAVDRLFEAKGRDRDKPVSMAVESVAIVPDYADPTDRERAFLDRFLPGPVTVLLQRGERVPDVLTAGRERVGVRVPDHEMALALLAAAETPVTATSANVSGEPSACRIGDVHAPIREAVAVVLDGGETPGGGSTVVDPSTGEIHRRGPLADDIEAWLAEH
ncbi:L-threonylcarbamoyladenylate synthase [Salinibaculum rarum]|uniref:L-threonylcarbamoyladenylate synthase n=1 Tax=Salinibaculum rarum TaxID=3058903 RepID=UPI00265D8EA9|nr:L-threonylcarbamoyladenylate synthase [Salinibaculum sp. KK48]